jgi:cation transport ATPase
MMCQRRNNKTSNKQPRNTHNCTNMSTIDSAQQETPKQSEENNQVIRHRYNALDRGDTDALVASMHKGDPQERDRQVLRSILFITSTGLAMIVAATFATVLELPDSWQNLWLAICTGFTLLFFVGVLRLTSELGL